MTKLQFMELCKDFFQYVLGPIAVVWATAKVNAKPKRKRTASRKRTR